MKNNCSIIVDTPVVCAIGENYIICIRVAKKVLMKVNVNGIDYYNNTCGVIVSDTVLQRFTVPMSELDFAGEYTVSYKEIICRLAYSCTVKEENKFNFVFNPVKKTGSINIYHISDTHGQFLPAVKAAEFFDGKLDLLILNGDISSSSTTTKEILLCYKIASRVTNGNIPCIITRGNHDLRGKFAEKLTDYIPNINGCFYYTLRLGSLWFLCLDCGEDKLDSHREYSGTVCFHDIRIKETAFIDSVINNKTDEYLSNCVLHRFVLSHIPFCNKNKELCKGERPFDIENEIYTDWCKKISKEICPDMLLCGHTHTLDCFEKNSDFDSRNLGCNIVLGGKPHTNNGNGYTGTAITVNDNSIDIRFTDEKKNIILSKNIKL